MNLLVQPEYSFNKPFDDTELSIVRITVVPTAQTRFLSWIALLMISVDSFPIEISVLSLKILSYISKNKILKYTTIV